MSLYHGRRGGAGDDVMMVICLNFGYILARGGACAFRLAPGCYVGSSKAERAVGPTEKMIA